MAAMMKPDLVFLPLSIAVLTISDSRTALTDKSGQYLVEQLTHTGHQLVEKAIVPDNIYQIRAQISTWIAQATVQVILTTGGTGLTGRDITPEAIVPLFDKEIPGFGELFRMISYEEIKTAALQSRVMAGVANGTYIFCLPGSTGACRTAWEGILQAQLDSRSRPCNFADLIPRLKET
jgi:molybdopterin adenylyltransferase